MIMGQVLKLLECMVPAENASGLPNHEGNG